MHDIAELNGKSLVQLKEIAKSLKLSRTEGLKKQELIVRILDHQAAGGAGEEKAHDKTDRSC